MVSEPRGLGGAALEGGRSQQRYGGNWSFEGGWAQRSQQVWKGLEKRMMRGAQGPCSVTGVSSEGQTYSLLCLHFCRCAPESLRQGAFSSASDVWMFGVTLWEMFSGGEEPWSGVPPYLILQRLEKDQARLPRPPLCSRALYALALRCWAPHPADRPSFSYLEELLQEVGTVSSPNTLSLSSLCSFSQGSMH